MEVDSDNELLIQLANGGSIEGRQWPDLRAEILARLDKIAHEQFPIPNLPPPRPFAVPLETDDRGRLVSPPPSSPTAEPSSQNADADKENAPIPAPAPAPIVLPSSTIPPPQPPRQLEPGQLPQQIQEMVDGIVNQLNKFEKQPPHTAQRLAELILRPGRHYKALAPYLHAVDRVVRVTSTAAYYPLPPAIPDMSSLRRDVNGDDNDDPASRVSWSNSTSSTLGTDEALGGALLTPIPWLTQQRSPERATAETPTGAQIHSESTETIDGPNGMGSIETVSVSVNGIRSAGPRAITQGELLRQEQRAGVVPVIQLSRSQEAAANGRAAAEEAREAGETNHEMANTDDITEDGEHKEKEEAEPEEEVPHARGPDEIGVGDTGLQKEGSSYPAGAGLESHEIDVEAAVGRKQDEETVKAEPSATPSPDDLESRASSETLRNSPGTESTATKREAGSPEGEPAKKIIKEDTSETGDLPDAESIKEDAEVAEPDAEGPEKMDTGK